MSKAIVTADWHLGVRNNNLTFQEIAKEFVEDFLIPLLDAESPDVLFILGDVFHHQKSVDVRILDLAYDLFHQIVAHVPDVYIITGNHDVYYKSTRTPNALRVLTETGFRGGTIHIINSPTVETWAGRKFYLVPWLQTQDEKDLFVEALQEMQPDVCLGHFAINNFEMSHNFVNRSGFPQVLFKENTSKTMTGHFHLRDRRENVIYTGCPFQMDWGDWGNEKGVYRLNMDSLRARFIPNLLSPTHEKVFVSNLKSGVTEETGQKIAGNFVKMIIDQTLSITEIDELQRQLEEFEPRTIHRVVENKMFVGDGAEYDEESIQAIAGDNPLQLIGEYLNQAEVPDNLDRDRIEETLHVLYQEIQNQT